MNNASSTKNINFWLANQAVFFLITLLGLIIFLCGRLALINTYGQGDVIWQDMGHFWNDMLYGSRLDLKTVATFLVPLYLLIAVFSMFGEKVNRWSFVVIKLMGLFLLIVCSVFAVINYYYFGAFGLPIDIFIFDFLEPENTREVSKTIWFDYPVVKAVLLLVLLIFGLWLSLKKIPLWFSSHWSIDGKLTRIIVSLLIFVLLALSARGAITARPLSMSRATLSPSGFLNKLVPNGLWSFYVASNQSKNSLSLAAVPPEQLADSLQFYLADSRVIAEPAFKDFQTTTTLTEDKPYPNVVYAQMESFGARLLEFQSEDNNVYASLKPHAEQDYFFTNFTASANNTTMSLEKLLFGHPYPAGLAGSKYRNVEYVSSAAKLFLSKGYRTIFITGGRKSWNNAGEFWQLQGFEEVYDEYTILQQVADAKGGRAWGVYDEYAFKFIEQILLEEKDRPVFVVLLTISNHSPFEPPEDYKGYPVNVDSVAKYTTLTDTAKIHDIMKTYQYANDALGNFVSAIKGESELAQSTIVGAAGDHELRYIFNNQSNELHWKYRVPFYLYLPEAYTENATKDLNRFGSHKDIFPTLYNRIFAQTPYYALGLDLLAADFDSSRAFALNDDFVMDESGAIHNSGSKKMYYRWVDSSYQDLEIANEKDSGLEALKHKSSAYMDIITALTRMQTEPKL